MRSNSWRAICIFLGAVLIFSALLLFAGNSGESAAAGERADEILSQLIEQRQPDTPQATIMRDADCPEVLVIDGREYIGSIRIPSADLELPVLARWSYPDLKIAPCRYSGSIGGDDLVIMAHNYPSHFGVLQDLQPGDPVELQDAAGNTICYRVELVEILPPSDSERMTAAEYALTLFTCTYGGENRVTVRCSRSF